MEPRLKHYCVRVGIIEFLVYVEQNLIFLNLFLIYMYSIVGDLRFKNVKLLSLPWALTAGIVGEGGCLSECLLLKFLERAWKDGGE